MAVAAGGKRQSALDHSGVRSTRWMMTPMLLLLLLLLSLLLLCCWRWCCCLREQQNWKQTRRDFACCCCCCCHRGERAYQPMPRDGVPTVPMPGAWGCFHWPAYLLGLCRLERACAWWWCRALLVARPGGTPADDAGRTIDKRHERTNRREGGKMRKKKNGRSRVFYLIYIRTRVLVQAATGCWCCWCSWWSF